MGFLPFAAEGQFAYTGRSQTRRSGREARRTGLCQYSLAYLSWKDRRRPSKLWLRSPDNHQQEVRGGGSIPLSSASPSYRMGELPIQS